jgi:DNA-binding MarR family transcriptional regulator
LSYSYNIVVVVVRHITVVLEGYTSLEEGKSVLRGSSSGRERPQRSHRGDLFLRKAEEEEYDALMGERQKEILRLVCENRDMDFHSLVQKTGKDRVTILQSASALEDKGLIKRIRVDPKNPKSRLVLHPTAKGLAVAVWYLGSSYDNHKKHYARKLVSEYEAIIPGIYDAPIAFKGLVNSFSLGSGIFDKSGNLLELSIEDKGRVLDYLRRYILAQNILDGNVEDVTAIDKAKMEEIKDIIKAGKNTERMFEIFREMGIKV